MSADCNPMPEQTSYKDRLVSEYKELSDRVYRLRAKVDSINSGETELDLTCPVELLQRQLDVMCEYMDILKERVRLVGVDVN